MNRIIDRTYVKLFLLISQLIKNLIITHEIFKVSSLANMLIQSKESKITGKIKLLWVLIIGLLILWGCEKESPSTGHVMIAWSIAYRSTGYNATENDFDIKILDSSHSGHYWDTRNEPDSPSIDGSGIGVGWMRYGVSTHLSKRPYKYKWKLSSSSYYNLYNNNYNSHDKLKGIIIARPI